MATVNGVTVEILRGGQAPLTQSVDVWAVAGRSGTGAQLMGSNTSSFRYTAILYGAAANVQARLNALSAAQGTIGSIADDFGDTHPGSLIVNVGEPVRKKVVWLGAPAVRAAVGIEGVRT
jgi:hypothetical protein